jgi:hypothetical protein
MFRFERPAPKLILPGFGHGRFIDAWTIVHIMSGIVLGALGLLIGMDNPTLLVSTLALLFLYELFESLLGIVEDVENALSDVFFGFAGAATVTWVNTYVQLTNSHTFQIAIFAFLIGLSGLYVGWRTHLVHLAAQKYNHALRSLKTRSGRLGTLRDNALFFCTVLISLPAVSLFLTNPKLSVFWFALAGSLTHVIIQQIK